jgi:hypothetical protein
MDNEAFVGEDLNSGAISGCGHQGGCGLLLHLWSQVTIDITQLSNLINQDLSLR